MSVVKALVAVMLVAFVIERGHYGERPTLVLTDQSRAIHMRVTELGGMLEPFPAHFSELLTASDRAEGCVADECADLCRRMACDVTVREYLTLAPQIIVVDATFRLNGTCRGTLLATWDAESHRLSQMLHVALDVCAPIEAATRRSLYYAHDREFVKLHGLRADVWHVDALPAAAPIVTAVTASVHRFVYRRSHLRTSFRANAAHETLEAATVTTDALAYLDTSGLVIRHTVAGEVGVWSASHCVIEHDEYGSGEYIADEVRDGNGVPASCSDTAPLRVMSRPAWASSTATATDVLVTRVGDAGDNEHVLILSETRAYGFLYRFPGLHANAYPWTPASWRTQCVTLHYLPPLPYPALRSPDAHSVPYLCIARQRDPCRLTLLLRSSDDTQAYGACSRGDIHVWELGADWQIPAVRAFLAGQSVAASAVDSVLLPNPHRSGASTAVWAIHQSLGARHVLAHYDSGELWLWSLDNVRTPKRLSTNVNAGASYLHQDCTTNAHVFHHLDAAGLHRTINLASLVEFRHLCRHTASAFSR